MARRRSTLSIESIMGKRVWVHRNLHTGGYSVRLTSNGRVLGSIDEVVLIDVEFRVWKGVQAASKKKGVRDVHLFCIGTVVPLSLAESCSVKATYDFRKHDTFVEKSTGIQMLRADRVHLGQEGMKVRQPYYDVNAYVKAQREAS